jgi:hypothetical protein
MAGTAFAQEPKTEPNESTETKQKNFDKKFRFGLKASPQPTWFKSSDANSKGSGANFGFGFGLMFDIRLSDIIHFTTGIGGDFEGGYINYKYEPGVFTANVLLDKENKYVEAKDGITNDKYEMTNGSIQYILADRQYKTTHVSIPILLKMMTQEYSGLRYFFNFGGELGIRVATKATDTYVSGVETTITNSVVSSAFVGEDKLKVSNIDLGTDAALVPVRFGMNLGFGTEYRLGGSTALITSVSYFQSFTNLMRKESRFITKGADNSYDPSTGYNFAQLNQGYFMRAIRINIGLMF